MLTKSNLSCLLHLGDQDQTPHFHHPAALLSSSSTILLCLLFSPSCLLTQLPPPSCNSSVLWVMPDNDLSCGLLCVCCMYVHLLPASYPAHHLWRSSHGCLLPTSCLCQFLLLRNSSTARSWKDCLDVLCNGAVHCGAEVPCDKSASSKTAADLTPRFFLESTVLINCLHSIKQGPCFYCHSCGCQETELI